MKFFNPGLTLVQSPQHPPFHIPAPAIHVSQELAQTEKQPNSPSGAPLNNEEVAENVKNIA